MTGHHSIMLLLWVRNIFTCSFIYSGPCTSPSILPLLPHFLLTLLPPVSSLSPPLSPLLSPLPSYSPLPPSLPPSLRIFITPLSPLSPPPLPPQDVMSVSLVWWGTRQTSMSRIASTTLRYMPQQLGDSTTRSNFCSIWELT